jgi:hypothetical protein
VSEWITYLTTEPDGSTSVGFRKITHESAMLLLKTYVADVVAQRERAVPRRGCSRMSEWQPISTAPRDGTNVLLRDDDGNGPYLMYWDASFINLLVGEEPGLWVAEGKHFTWCDRDPAASPTHWMQPPAGENQ